MRFVGHGRIKSGVPEDMLPYPLPRIDNLVLGTRSAGLLDTVGDTAMVEATQRGKRGGLAFLSFFAFSHMALSAFAPHA